MKTLLVIVMATLSMLSTGAALAQNANMMNGGMWNGGWMGGWMGGYGGLWLPFLLAVVVVGLVAWILRRGGK